MINIDTTDNLEAIASVTNVIEFTCSVVDGTTVGSSEGKVANSNTTIWTATAATRILSMTFVNTHSSAVTLTVNKDPGNAGTLYKFFSISLGIGYSLVFDGARFAVFDASGNFQSGGGLSDGDKGDITVSGGVWTIDNEAVTYAKMQHVSATDKLLGRSTAGAGDVEEIACTAAGRAILDDANAAAQRATLGAAAAGANPDITSLRALVYDIQVYNLKPVVNAAVNKLDIFTKSGGAAPDASNPIIVSIPDGNGFTNRTRNATYLSGTSQFIMADAANYWSKGSLDAEIKTAYVYAIWDANGGIVWALGGYSGFTRCPASTTATDDDFFLLEASSTYTKVITDYCVCVGKIRYQYDTADTPDHTIQATVLDAPQVVWNPKSDYGYQKNLATTNTSASDITEYSVVSVVAKQSGNYDIWFGSRYYVAGGTSATELQIKVGSATYGSAVVKTRKTKNDSESGLAQNISGFASCYLNAGDTIHGGLGLTGASGNRFIMGDDNTVGNTNLIFRRTD